MCGSVCVVVVVCECVVVGVCECEGQVQQVATVHEGTVSGVCVRGVCVCAWGMCVCVRVVVVGWWK